MVSVEKCSKRNASKYGKNAFLEEKCKRGAAVFVTINYKQATDFYDFYCQNLDLITSQNCIGTCSNINQTTTQHKKPLT